MNQVKSHQCNLRVDALVMVLLLPGSVSSIPMAVRAQLSQGQARDQRWPFGFDLDDEICDQKPVRVPRKSLKAAFVCSPTP